MATDMLEKPTEADLAHAEHTRNVRHYQPNVDIVELAEELIVYADMPGATAEGIDVDFENGTLTIHGKVKPRQGDETNYVLQEYGVGHFYRTFRVSETVDSQRISAHYADGVLVLHLPKVEAARPRKINVKPS